MNQKHLDAFRLFVKPTDKVLCTFSSEFGGSYDVRYVKEIGVKDCTCVDIKHPPEMDDYGYKIITGCAFDFFDNCKEEYDVVICDPWSNLNKRVVIDYMSILKRIAKKYIIIGIRYDKQERGLLYGQTVKDDNIQDILVLRNNKTGLFWRFIKC